MKKPAPAPPSLLERLRAIAGLQQPGARQFGARGYGSQGISRDPEVRRAYMKDYHRRNKKAAA